MAEAAEAAEAADSDCDWLACLDDPEPAVAAAAAPAQVAVVANAAVGPGPVLEVCVARCQRQKPYFSVPIPANPSLRPKTCFLMFWNYVLSRAI